MEAPLVFYTFPQLYESFFLQRTGMPELGGNHRGAGVAEIFSSRMPIPNWSSLSSWNTWRIDLSPARLSTSSCSKNTGLGDFTFHFAELFLRTQLDTPDSNKKRIE